MSDEMEVPEPGTGLMRTLQELIDALDRRIPHIERVGEAAIVADATRLRASAMQRLAELRQVQ